MLQSKQVTIILVLSLISMLAIVISSIILINSSGMDQRLQGWVNLLWVPVAVLFLIIDRLCVKKYGTHVVNKVELYILGILILLVVLNWIRLRFQH